ncbi:MAG: hypothetical protein OEW08_12275, partial [Gammaproteobacteria bacterium]|nr:hypothetical protein [Gammaproteobacteria bacterium]
VVSPSAATPPTTTPTLPARIPGVMSPDGTLTVPGLSIPDPPTTQTALPSAPPSVASTAEPFTKRLTQAPLDLVLLVDLSPYNLAVVTPALRLRTAHALISQLRAMDRVQVIGYTDKGIAYSELTPLDTPAQRNAVRDILSALPTAATQPFLSKALQQAHATFTAHRENTRNQLIALIGEGGLPVGDNPKALHKTRKALAEYLPALARQGIRIYPITHSENANLPLLKVLARDSGGRVIPVDHYQSHTKKALAQMLADNRALHINKTTEQLFDIAQDYENFLILANKQTADSRYTLTTPKGEHLLQQNLPTQHRWLTNETYDLIALHHPPLGTWKLSNTTAQGETRFFQTLKLHHNILTTTLPQGIDFVFEAWLTDDQGHALPAEILDYFIVQVSITAPDTTQPTQVLARRDKESKDKFHTVLPMTKSGINQLSLVAESPVAALSSQLTLDITANMFPQAPTAAAEQSTPLAHEKDPSATEPHPPSKTVTQVVTGVLLDTLETIRQKLEPLLHQGMEYTQETLLPKATDYAQNTLLPKLNESVAGVVPQHQALLQHPDAKWWGGGGLAGLLSLLLLRRWLRKRKNAATTADDGDMDYADIDTPAIGTGDAPTLPDDTNASVDSTTSNTDDARFNEGGQFQLDQPAQAPISPNDGMAELEENVRLNPS